MAARSKIYYPNRKQNNKNGGLRTFSSFEEANEANAKAMAQLTPEKHLTNTTELIKRIYEEKLRKPMDKKMKFRK